MIFSTRDSPASASFSRDTRQTFQPQANQAEKDRLQNGLILRIKRAAFTNTFRLKSCVSRYRVLSILRVEMGLPHRNPAHGFVHLCRGCTTRYPVFWRVLGRPQWLHAECRNAALRDQIRSCVPPTFHLGERRVVLCDPSRERIPRLRLKVYRPRGVRESRALNCDDTERDTGRWAAAPYLAGCPATVRLVPGGLTLLPCDR